MAVYDSARFLYSTVLNNIHVHSTDVQDWLIQQFCKICSYNSFEGFEEQKSCKMCSFKNFERFDNQQFCKICSFNSLQDLCYLKFGYTAVVNSFVRLYKICKSSKYVVKINSFHSSGRNRFAINSSGGYVRSLLLDLCNQQVCKFLQSTVYQELLNEQF